MEWYYVLGMGLACWLFGYATGSAQAFSGVMKQMLSRTQQAPAAPGGPDLTALMAMMGQKGQGEKP